MELMFLRACGPVHGPMPYPDHVGQADTQSQRNLDILGVVGVAHRRSPRGGFCIGPTLVSGKAVGVVSPYSPVNMSPTSDRMRGPNQQWIYVTNTAAVRSVSART